MNSQRGCRKYTNMITNLRKPLDCSMKVEWWFLYTFECDLGDGWEDPEVHKDAPENHEKALKMGANIIRFVFSGKN
jgi:hypothetical protein